MGSKKQQLLIFVPSSARALTGACPANSDVESSIKANMGKQELDA